MQTSLIGPRTTHCRAIAFTVLLAIWAVPTPAASETARLDENFPGLFFISWDYDADLGLVHAGVSMDVRFWPPVNGVPRYYVSMPIPTFGPLDRGPAGSFDVVLPFPPGTLEAGGVLNMSSQVTWRDVPLFECCSSELGPLFYREFLSSGTFTFTADNAVIEEHPDGISRTADTSARFTAIIHVLDPSTGLPLETRHLEGRGGAHFFMNVHAGFLDYQYTLGPIPEPATMTLLGLGAAGLAARRRIARRATG